jgi:hypothetical protein
MNMIRISYLVNQLIIYFDDIDIDSHVELFDKYDEEKMRSILEGHMDDDEIEELIGSYYD